MLLFYEYRQPGIAHGEIYWSLAENCDKNNNKKNVYPYNLFIFRENRIRTK